MSGKATTFRFRDDHGFALFAVLSFLLLAASVVTPLVMNARTSALIARNVADDVKMRLLADGLIDLAKAEITAKAGLPDFSIPQVVQCAFGSSRISYEFQNHAGLIDLNAASADLLRVGFLASGHSADIAEKLAQTVLRFRSVEQGADQFSPVQVAGGLKFGLFESVDELNDFQATDMDLTPDYHRTFTTRTATGTVLKSAMPSATELVLKNMPEQDAYFVVSGSPPIVALSLSISVSRQGKATHQALMDTGPDAAGIFRNLSPLRPIGQKDGVDVLPSLDNTVDCNAFFDRGTIDAMRILVDGDDRQ